MLSILIPTYNYNITKLVNDLHEQAIGEFVDFEIIVMEDGSTLFLNENKTVSELKFCQYTRLEKNIGRSAIRNRLADESKYKYLLFLDCDAGISSDYFIKRYLLFCAGNSIILGGRIYETNADAQRSLLTKYGQERERNNTKNLKIRDKYQIFTSPNFLISKSIFQNIRFDESVKGYGHEDTIFGIMLHRAGFKFKYIDNPVVHTGIEDNKTFIDKTEKALYNLFALYESGEYPELENESKLTRSFIRLKKWKFVGLFNFFFKIIKPLIIRQITGKNPSLFLFDIFKLGILCSISRGKTARLT